jgi:dipeptidyl aminopeptidase/acylaminoacyl peptidase
VGSAIDEQPVPASAVATGMGSMAELSVADGAAMWLESRPREGGRVTLVRSAGSGREELTPAPWNVRSRVHEYGGGAFTRAADGIWFVNAADQNVYAIEPSGIRQITTSSVATRFADLEYDPLRGRLHAVCERHLANGSVVNELVAIDLTTGSLLTLHEGRDFYASPRLAPDGATLAALAWDHPNMPWDGTQLVALRLSAEGVADETVIAGGARESILQPAWDETGALCFLSDRSGWWNLYRHDAAGTHAACPDDAEYGSPPWAFGLRDYALLGRGFAAAVRRTEGSQELVLVELESGLQSPLHEGCVGYSYLVAQPGALCFVGHHSDRPPAIVRLDLGTREQTELARGALPGLDPVRFSHARHLAVSTRDERRTWCFYYAPSHAPNPPPLMVMSHGGPTSAANASLSLLVQFYTSRGWAVADVNYRGSTGYGVTYRRALDGRWGELDVQDCEDVARHLIGRGLADPSRVAIRGGSAGGFTTLAALTRTTTFRAGASHYGIADLEILARDTHKFESHYLDSLLGSPDALVERSPIHHIDGFRCPVIFFQGGEDRVVPPNQTESMVAALDRRKLPVACMMFPDEGHGFRAADNIVRALEGEYVFLCRVLDLPVPSEMPPIEIRNL